MTVLSIGKLIARRAQRVFKEANINLDTGLENGVWDFSIPNII